MRVVVTGAAGGIGTGVAERLAAADHEVVGIDRDRSGLAELPDAVETRVVDLRDGDAVREALAEDPIDAVVTCAGGYEIASLEDTTPDAFRRQLDTNLTTVHTVVRATAPTIRERHGRIVVVGSMLGSVALPYHGAYSAAKAGVRGYTDALRRELEPLGATVVLVEPGPVRTGFNERAADALRSRVGGGSRVGDGSRVGGGSRDATGRDGDAESVYADAYRAFESYTPTATGVDTVVKSIVTATTTRNPRTRYRVSRRARWLPRLAAVLPDRLYDRLVRSGLPGGTLGRLIDR